ncbi:unnamed protein product [Amoebophrya sp. A120]|nr:unnamed protein product [Amoebophrya sp. A120]|eukprot:GSA120T00013705001.1
MNATLLLSLLHPNSYECPDKNVIHQVSPELRYQSVEWEMNFCPSGDGITFLLSTVCFW